MQGKTREHWQELCEQAANEQDATKMLEIIEEINRLLHAKYSHLYPDAPRKPSAPPK